MAHVRPSSAAVSAGFVVAALVTALVIAPGPAAAQTQKKLAVLQFVVAKGVAVDRETFSQRLQNAALKAAPRLSVMTQANIMSMVQAQGKTLDQCEGECAVETGRLLGADFIVTGRISKPGKKLGLSMQLYDSTSGLLLAGEDVDAVDEEELLNKAVAAAPSLFAPLVARAGGSAEQTPAQQEGKDVTVARKPAPQPGKTFTEPKSGLEFIGLPGGILVGGNFAGQSVAPFSLGKTAVTVAAYAKCVSAGACSAPSMGSACNWNTGRNDHPVNCVDWNQAKAFCAWIGGRLPTAQEREWAASGGEGREYPWGFGAPGPHACWDGSGNDRSANGWSGTCPVTAHPASASKHGLLGLAGNVWECLDTDYSGGKEVRGGSWSDDNAGSLRASYRGRGGPSPGSDARLGLRCGL